MPLRHERPSVEYMRELRAVARSAGALREHLPKVNLLPDGFPLDQVKGYCNALVRLPDGTAEASIGPLRASDSELNRIRQRFIPAHDEDAGDPEPLVPRDSNFDLRLVGLMAAVRAAIERYKVETGEELDTDVTPDRPENPEVDAAKPAAFDDIAVAADNLGQVEAEIDAADPSVAAELENEKRLIVSADVNIGSAAATLSTEAPRPTVLGWLDDNLNSVANEMDRLVETAGPKAAGVGKEIGGLAGDLTEIWFPKLTKSLRAVSGRLTNIRAIILGTGDAPATSPPADFSYVEVYNRLFRGETVPESWAPFVTELDFFFSDLHHLDETTRKQIKGDRESFSDARLLENLTALQSLSLHATQVADIAPLENLTALQRLSLGGTQVADIAPLQNLTALQSLSLHATQVADIAPLENLTALQRLSLGGTQVADIAPLQNLTALQSLYLTGTQVADIARLENLTALQRLDLKGTQVADIAPLENLSALQNLNLRNTQVADIAPLENLTALQYLGISDTQVADIAPLQNLTALQRLDLDGTQVADIAALENLTALQILDLNGTQVADIAPLENLTALQSLKLEGTQVANIAPLKNLTALQSLNLWSTQVADIAPLKNLSALQSLYLTRTHVADTSPLAHLVEAGLIILGP
ncbi:leucine-rich repeat domain-containing protein [Hoeflea sp.]|uniref:leucine-rich repeat domain-containing protein n=1 Tax=Hoeflea sp. TaxID=1940281 RepID=UPI003748FD37